MAARESEDADIMTTISVPNTNDISDDEEMSDATEKKDVGHTRRGVSPIHIPAEWGKAEPTGDGDPVCQQVKNSILDGVVRPIYIPFIASVQSTDYGVPRLCKQLMCICGRCSVQTRDLQIIL